MPAKILILLLLTLPYLGNAQNFVNGDLNGIVDFVSVPSSWTQIPHTNPICQALTAPEATVDILDANGPSASGGVAGIPFSGNTFCSALHAGVSGSYLWHEGIMQQVTGLSVGTEYILRFYQTVVKQDNCRDQVGSWRIYVDGALIATSATSTSLLSPHDINLQWELREIQFTATANSHNFQFMAWDDDANIETSITDITGALRMGIDSISLYTIPPTPPIVDLGNDTVLCSGESLTLDATFPFSTYLWQDGSTDSVFTVHQAGMYWVEVSNADGTDVDTIHVSYTDFPTVNLIEDSVICEGTSLFLDATTPGVNHTWQDNSNNPIFEVVESGTYWVEVDNLCGVAVDSVVILYEECPLVLEMPNVFTPNGDHTNDLFLAVESVGVHTSEITIVNRWGNSVYFSEDVHMGWDGKSGKLDCVEGVYFWKVIYTDYLDNEYSMHGFVHLVR